LDLRLNYVVSAPDYKNGQHGTLKAMKEMMESQIGSLVPRMEADRKTDREEMKQERIAD
jgi:hypothetical protein